MKKILALMGSPRMNKNTDKLLDFMLEGVDKDEFQVNKVYLNKLKINACTGCDHCAKTALCVFDDGMTDIYNEFDNSDIVILAAPIYFNSINGLTKTVIDRCQRYWSIKYKLGQNYKRDQDRKAYFIGTGGAPFSFYHFNGVQPILELFFKSINVKHIGSYYMSDTDNVSPDDLPIYREELNEIGKNIDNIRNFCLHR